MRPNFFLAWLAIFVVNASYNLNFCSDHLLPETVQPHQLNQVNSYSKAPLLPSKIEACAFQLWHAVQSNNRSNLGAAVNKVVEDMGRDRLRAYLARTSNSVLVQNKYCPAHLFCSSLWQQAQSQLSTGVTADYEVQQDPLLWQIIKTPYTYCLLYLLGLHQPSPPNTNLKTKTQYWYRLRALIQEELAGHEPGGTVFSCIVSAEIKRLCPTEGVTFLIKQLDDALCKLDATNEIDAEIFLSKLSPEHRQLYLRKQSFLRLKAALWEVLSQHK